MLSLIEALNYRCLRYLHQPLEPFHVLVGPNASGKTTFLDVVAFLGRMVSDGLEAAISERTQHFRDLLWGRMGDGFELALEASIPEDRRALLAAGGHFSKLRYEVKIIASSDTSTIQIAKERVSLTSQAAEPAENDDYSLFPEPPPAPDSLFITQRNHARRTIINKAERGNDNFNSEVHSRPGKGWVNSYRFGPHKSALGNLPTDESKFPVTTWFKEFLAQGVQQFILNSLLMRKASPPNQPRGFRPDGSNLPWVIGALKRDNPEQFSRWLNHVRTALPDIGDISTTIREDDKHCYFRLLYDSGLQIPSWMASDGTLRLLALTLPAYLPEVRGIYLIEEPENGIHPRAVEIVYQALSSVYDAQVLLATHSPLILKVAKPEEVLCFAKNDAGATAVVRGDQHPALRDWKGETNLGTLYAAGVLG